MASKVQLGVYLGRAWRAFGIDSVCGFEKSPPTYFELFVVDLFYVLDVEDQAWSCGFYEM